MIRARLENLRIDEIFQSGLHEFIDHFVEDNNRLGTAIAQQYFFDVTGGRKTEDRDR